jgi:phosphonate transport system permease protein
MTRLHRPPLITSQRLWAGLSIGAIGLSLYVAGVFRQEIFNPSGIPQLVEFFVALGHPDLSAEFLQLTGNATLITLSYAAVRF